jgi:hypothetical protein
MDKLFTVYYVQQWIMGVWLMSKVWLCEVMKVLDRHFVMDLKAELNQ